MAGMSRRELREQVFLLLFRAEFHTEEELKQQKEIYREWCCAIAKDEDDEDREIPEEYALMVITKFESIIDHLSDIDRRLSDNTEKWSLGRIGKTELTILRLALYEILYDEEIPTGVAINEAVELAKRYGQDGAGSFVNGILAKFAK